MSLCPVTNGLNTTTFLTADNVLPLSISTISTALMVVSDILQHLIPEYPPNSVISEFHYFDFIIIGGGTAGCILANRLTEVKEWNVLLIEAGGDPPITSKVPGYFILQAGSISDWSFVVENDGQSSQAQKNEQQIINSGKMLGGSSSQSFLFYNRGTKINCADWNITGWNWEICLKYFKKLENLQIPAIKPSETAKYHGSNGPVVIRRHESYRLKEKMFAEYEDILLNSVQEMGFKNVLDINDPNTLGHGRAQFTVNGKGRRTSTAESYILPIKDRKNFYILKNTLTTKILFDNNNCATGVEIITDSGHKQKIRAKKEVILSAGTIKSAQLLMLSGIGPKKDLEQLNIKIVANLPVGRKFKDSAVVPFYFTGKQVVTNPAEGASSMGNVDTFPTPAILGEFSLFDDSLYPDIEHIALIFPPASPFITLGCNVNYNYKTNLCSSVAMNNLNKEILNSFAFLKNPQSYGNITLLNTDPKENPEIYSGFFTQNADLSRFTEGIIRLTKLKDTSYWRTQNSEIVKLDLPECDCFEFLSNDYWRCYTKQMSRSYFMPIGSCRMGDCNDEDAVVDSRLNVYGVSNLRVVDASVIPSMRSGETLSMVMMLAERAADLIKEDYNLKAA